MTDITTTARTPYGTFGIACRKLRMARGWTQVQLAKKLDVSQVSVAWYETGRNLPSSATMSKLSVLFGVPLEFLQAHKRTLFERAR